MKIEELLDSVGKKHPAQTLSHGARLAPDL